MFAQLICPDRTEEQIHELYEVIAALCHREGIQIEDRGERVEILVCPQGKILVDEVDQTLFLSANTRHAGPGFHAFVITFFQAIEEELPDGTYELIDDTEFDKDEDFHRLYHLYEHELDYLKDKLLHDPNFREKNYLFDETFYLPKQEEGMINTSAGKISLAELEEMDPEQLMDLFYVWNNWDRDARFYLNAALTLLAKEGVGEFSAMNETTEKMAAEIADYLEIAHEQDPDLPLPLLEYQLITKLLNREDKLLDARGMGKEATQYRTREVYHIFEGARIAAPGSAERSYDPVTKSLNLMAPYTDIDEWTWLLQASRQPDILPSYKTLQESTPNEKKDGISYWARISKTDQYYSVDGLMKDPSETIYFHGIAKDETLAKQLEQCIYNSSFLDE